MDARLLYKGGPGDTVFHGIGSHPTSTSHKMKQSDGIPRNSVHQDRSKICNNGNKLIVICSACWESSQGEVWMCHSDNGRKFFQEHFASVYTKGRLLLLEKDSF